MKNGIDNRLYVNSTDIIVFVWQKRKPLAIISFIAVILSAIASFLITPLYKSTVVLYPPSSTSVAKSLFSENYMGNQNLLQFGGEDQVEQLLQVLSSTQIKNRIIEKHKLFSHYNINKTSKYARSRISKEYNNNFAFKPTKYMSVVIEVLDKDRFKAAQMANDVAGLIDTIMFDIQRDRARLSLRLVEEEYNKLKKNIKTVEDSLNKMRTMGLYNYDAQTEVVTDAYANAIRMGNRAAVKELEEKINFFSKYSGIYIEMRDRYYGLTGQLPTMQQKYLEAKIDVEQRLPQKFVVDYATPADKKAYPKRSLIVLLSTVSAFILGLIILLTVENYSKKQEDAV